ncbi:VOC family protein [Paenibacillus antri]|uniref:VOC family protein n=1 Tax=Paenibacillus antri TaxID=2582848 RepID=A0A5R9FY47_9BACL|nr:VOC family protein [Paenibacillus antri]TLS48411.1 VOC family protein [Paenibacillus antri]
MILRLNPYLFMDGQAKEAIAFYEKTLDAKLLGVQTFGEMPANPEFPIPEAAKDRVAHSMLKIGETDLMISDTFPGQPLKQGEQVTVCITTNDSRKSKSVFDALQDGGTVNMPFQETFWTPGYGVVTDKFGVTFHITTETAAK